MTRLRPWLGLLGCLVLALVVAAAAPDPATQVRRHDVTARPGQWAETPAVVARTTSVAVTRSAKAGYDDAFDSRQALVVVGVDAQVRRHVVEFSQVSLHTRDDRDYEPRDEFSSAALTETPPGFTRHATLVFEVPRDRLAGAALAIDPDGTAVTGYDDAIRLDLGLTDPVRVGPQVAAVPDTTLSTT